MLVQILENAPYEELPFPVSDASWRKILSCVVGLKRNNTFVLNNLPSFSTPSLF